MSRFVSESAKSSRIGWGRLCPFVVIMFTLATASQFFPFTLNLVQRLAVRLLNLGSGLGSFVALSRDSAQAFLHPLQQCLGFFTKIFLASHVISEGYKLSA
jgi:hypothetical protein